MLESLETVGRERDAAIERAEKAEADLKKALDTRSGETYCAYCGEGFPVDNEAATQVSEHIRTCEKHPMRRVEKERDEAMKLAYIGEHRFPQNSWKVRCEEEVEGRRAAEKEVEKLAKEDVAFLSGRAELCGRFCFGMVPPRLAGWPQRDFGACANALVRLAYGGDPPREDEYAYDQEDALAAFRAMLHMPAHRCTHAVLDAFRKATENVRQDGEEPCRR